MGLKDNGWVKFFRKRLQPNVGAPMNAGGEGSAVQVITRSEHCISRRDISNSALKVLYRLSEAGYASYLVGGSVRDLLLKRRPKDFDIATNATPEEVRRVFRNSRIIGRRFRLVHVYFQDEVIEVSTFRANAQEDGENEVPMIQSDNTYGTIEEDAWRRDFTVNALYYNIKDFSVLDFMGGLQDLQKARICMIGDPSQRFHEDPVRLLRAIRLAAKLEFDIDEAMLAPLKSLVYLLEHVPEARLMDEFIKLFFEGNAVVTFDFLKKMGYLSALFPDLSLLLQQPMVEKLIDETMRTTDHRFLQQKRLTPGFLFSTLLWPVVQHYVQKFQKSGSRFSVAFQNAMQQAITSQSQVCLITKRMILMMRSVWIFQYHLEKRRARRVYALLGNRYFRAAFDLLVLRAEVGEISADSVQWWDAFQKAGPKERDVMLAALETRRA